MPRKFILPPTSVEPKGGTASLAEALIADYLMLGTRLREAQSRAGLVGLVRKLKLTLWARQHLPGATSEHLSFMVETLPGKVQASSTAIMSPAETTGLVNTLVQLEENHLSAFDPACLTFGCLREQALLGLAVGTLVRSAMTSGLIKHENVSLVSCCYSASAPHILEVIIRDRKAFGYHILVLETEPTGSDIMTQPQSVATSMARLIPVLWS